MRSCNLGNLFADAIVKSQKQQPSNTQWATLTLGFWNMGGIRSGSIDKSLQGKDIVNGSFFLVHIVTIYSVTDSIEKKSEILRQNNDTF